MKDMFGNPYCVYVQAYIDTRYVVSSLLRQWKEKDARVKDVT